MKNVQIMMVLIGCIFLLIGLIANQQIGISFLIIGLIMLLFGVIKEATKK
ncbi:MULTISPECIES: hypothetical protein [Mammaliicoccus]|uniref:Uncharacterized protein n=1 Tax=Mammaliicoccus fleurettii TaxID=150056 RepID=A0ABS5MLL4_9STAP|nr:MULTISPECIES: hypothetical protein [Mammaliicoccus]MBL0846978.1 hypothetical protein [Mammaliicoccus fleurettii]MBO3063268.1 hypothetical protein [Mammaliicoccus fleurettii]MBS3671702.1 hypothetical protein [Mammaliicoccus fleurettii]MBS3696800.1 hypothetical protein [Mammaliicoccus fleurettii]MBW0765920.1 hypothetical protein [Mammaliicoccus fleurettii]